MADFQPAFEFLLPDEGGFVIDQGGATKFGISQRAYPQMTVEGIRNLTITDAERLYLRDWWEPNHYGDLESQSVASKIFNLAVDMQGPGEHKGAPANKLLQGAAVLSGASGLACDGLIGPETISAVNNAPEGILMRNLIALAIARYKQIAEAHPDDPHYQNSLAGWIRRAKKVPLIDPVPDVTGERSM